VDGTSRIVEPIVLQARWRRIPAVNNPLMVSGGPPHSNCAGEGYDKPDYHLHAGIITLLALIAGSIIGRVAIQLVGRLRHPEPITVSRLAGLSNSSSVGTDCRSLSGPCAGRRRHRHVASIAVDVQ
jgi:hypothetical protein